MTRLIDADAIQVFATSETLKHIITDLIDAQPTVDAVPVEYIESEIKRMDDDIDLALEADEDEWAEHEITRKMTLVFTLAKWRAERKEE